MQQIGIYAGSFDPIHQGHLSFALESIKSCQLDKVIFLPEPVPRAKYNVSPLSQRIQQIQMMIRPYPSLDVLHLTSSQFTVNNTLAEIQKRFENTKLTLLVGSDVALRLHTWSGIKELLSACDVSIGLRSSNTINEVTKQISRLQKLSPMTNFTIVQTNHASLTSSGFRNQNK